MAVHIPKLSISQQMKLVAEAWISDLEHCKNAGDPASLQQIIQMIDDVASENDSVKGQLAARDDEIERLTLAALDHQQQMVTLQNDMQQQTTQHKQQLQQQQREQQQIQAKNTEYEQLIATQTTKMKQQMDDNASLQQQVVTLQQEIIILKARLVARNSDVMTRDSDIKQLNDVARHHQRDMDALRREVLQLQQQQQAAAAAVVYVKTEEKRPLPDMRVMETVAKMIAPTTPVYVSPSPSPSSPSPKIFHQPAVSVIATPPPKMTPSSPPPSTPQRRVTDTNERVYAKFQVSPASTGATCRRQPVGSCTVYYYGPEGKGYGWRQSKWTCCNDTKKHPAHHSPHDDPWDCPIVG